MNNDEEVSGGIAGVALGAVVIVFALVMAVFGPCSCYGCDPVTEVPSRCLGSVP